MKLVKVAIFLQFACSRVEASGKKYASRLERPTKTVSGASRSRVVLTTTLSPRIPEAYDGGDAAVAPEPIAVSGGAGEHSQEITQRRTSSRSTSSVDPFITPTRSIATRDLGVSPSMTSSGVDDSASGDVSAKEAREPTRFLRSSISRSLVFDTPPRSRKLSLGTSAESASSGRTLFEAADEEPSEGDAVVTESVRVSKKRRVSRIAQSSSPDK